MKKVVVTGAGGYIGRHVIKNFAMRVMIPMPWTFIKRTGMKGRNSAM